MISNARMRPINLERSNMVISLGKCRSLRDRKAAPHIPLGSYTIQSYHKVIITKCLLYSGFSATSIVLFCFFVSVPFLVCLHDLSLRNRTRAGPARSLFVLSRFHFQPPSPASLHTQTDRQTRTHTHSYPSRLYDINSSWLTCACVCASARLFIYKQAPRRRQRSRQ